MIVTPEPYKERATSLAVEERVFFCFWAKNRALEDALTKLGRWFVSVSVTAKTGN
jgi:hypothetical protein